jgi:integrase/recombinase XerD
VRDLRDRALIATLTYSFARIGAALKMKVEDLRPRGSAWTIQLHEKGGKQHAMPCHHALAEMLHPYIAAAGIAEDRKGWLFRTSRGHKATILSDKPMAQSDAWRMIRRRAAVAGINASIGNHSFRATGITAYLANDGATHDVQFTLKTFVDLTMIVTRTWEADHSALVALGSTVPTWAVR